MKSQTPLLASLWKASFLLSIFRKEKPHLSSVRKQCLTARCLVCRCCRHINGTYVKHLEGFLLFEEDSHAEKLRPLPKLEHPLLDARKTAGSEHQTSWLYWYQGVHKQTIFFFFFFFTCLHTTTVDEICVNLQVLWENSHHDSTWGFQTQGSSLTGCMQLTSQQVRQQGPTLLRNGVIPFSDVLK